MWMNREDANRATRAGAIAACISGGMTTFVYLIAELTGAKGDNALAFYNDPSIIFDIIIIFLLAWFIYKKSRVAAILMFAYFLSAKLYLAVSEGQFSGLFVGAIFLYFFGRAALGAFSFHKLEKVDNPNYKRKRSWIWWIVTPVTLIVFGLFSLGLMTMTGFMPSTEVQVGQDVNYRHIEKLTDAKIISSRDDLVYFYSGGFSSVLEEGVFVSRDTFSMYYTDANGEVQLYQLPLDEITKVELVAEGSFVEDALYKASTDDPDAWIQFSLSIENQGHLKFIEELKGRIQTEAEDVR